MENVTETKPLGLHIRWRHLIPAARIPKFFRSANTWGKEVSLRKCAVHDRSGKMFLFSGWIESFSVSVKNQNSSLCNQCRIDQTHWSVDDAQPFGHKTGYQQSSCSAQFRNSPPTYAREREHYLAAILLQGIQNDQSSNTTSKKQTGWASRKGYVYTNVGRVALIFQTELTE